MDSAPVAAAPATAATYHVVRPKDRPAALGLAVSYLMNLKAFADLRFGVWSKVLVGQVGRGHYVIIGDGNKIVAFAGWAFASREKAEGWLVRNEDISFAESRTGEVGLINCVAITDHGAHRFLLGELRKALGHCDYLVFKRFYPDGRVRPVRLNVNEFVERHVARLVAKE